MSPMEFEVVHASKEAFWTWSTSWELVANWKAANIHIQQDQSIKIKKEHVQIYGDCFKLRII